jgi:hypothetical protein
MSDTQNHLTGNIVLILSANRLNNNHKINHLKNTQEGSNPSESILKITIN